MFRSNDELVDYLVATGAIKSKRVEEAFRRVDRRDFVREEFVKEAYADYPLPIGSGQTISQPTTIAIMLELLDVHKGHKVLEIGTGSGYQTALLAELVGEKGLVVSIEIVKELHEFAKKNLARYGYKNIILIHGDGSLGYPDLAPYDRIIVSACAPAIPPPLIEQLKDGGRMVLPVGRSFFDQDMTVCIKKGNKMEKMVVGKFAFVPLRGRYGVDGLGGTYL